jgi:hypothetical protein
MNLIGSIHHHDQPPSLQYVTVLSAFHRDNTPCGEEALIFDFSSTVVTRATRNARGSG